MVRPRWRWRGTALPTTATRSPLSPFPVTGSEWATLSPGRWRWERLWARFRLEIPSSPPHRAPPVVDLELTIRAWPRRRPPSPWTVQVRMDAGDLLLVGSWPATGVGLSGKGNPAVCWRSGTQQPPRAEARAGGGRP